ncbi:MAG: cytochrome c oxidase, subunit [Frankiales bacterium]|nr:cytochrome c oxidase, subunit [Frankiales bacterium]
MSPSPVAPRRFRTSARLAAVLVPAALVTSGCNARDLYENGLSLGFPDPVTEEAVEIYELWLGSVAAATVVGLAVSAMIIYAMVRYRKTGDQLPRQVRYNLPIEVLYTAIPFVIIAVLFYYTTVTQNFVNEEDEGGADVTIGVVGFQWNWTFRHEEQGVQVTGEPGQPAQLVLPVGQRVRFVETSPDVIHSFWVPKFLFKRDVVPGRENVFEITITKEGEYIGRCAELCGEKHSAMNFSVKAVSADAYQDYVAGLGRNPDNRIIGPAAGAVRNAEEAAEQIAGRPE